MFYALRAQLWQGSFQLVDFTNFSLGTKNAPESFCPFLHTIQPLAGHILYLFAVVHYKFTIFAFCELPEASLLHSVLHLTLLVTWDLQKDKWLSIHTSSSGNEDSIYRGKCDGHPCQPRSGAAWMESPSWAEEIRIEIRRSNDMCWRRRAINDHRMQTEREVPGRVFLRRARLCFSWCWAVFLQKCTLVNSDLVHM